MVLLWGLQQLMGHIELLMTKKDLSQMKDLYYKIRTNEQSQEKIEIKGIKVSKNYLIENL